MTILLLYQIFFSPQVQRRVIISNKNGIYELPDELTNDLRLRKDQENLKASYCQRQSRACTHTAQPTPQSRPKAHKTAPQPKKAGCSTRNPNEKSPKYTAPAAPHPKIPPAGQPWRPISLKTFSHPPKDS